MKSHELIYLKAGLVKWLLSLIAGICGILLTIISLSAIFVSIQIYPNFDWNGNVLSHLGDENALSTKNIFNFGLIITGILGIIFSLGCLKKSKHIKKIGFALLIIASVALMGVAIFNLPDQFHVPFSTAFFVIAPLSLYVIGIGFMFEKQQLNGIFAIAAATVSAIFVVLVAIGFLSAITEFIAAFSIVGWMFFFSLRLVKENFA